MAPLQALRQSLGALIGAPELRLRDILERVKGRYPDAAPLPGRPELDRLLEEAGAPLSWDASAADGAGAYRLATLAGAQTAGTTTQFSRHGTRLSSAPETDSERADAAAVEERLNRNLNRRGHARLDRTPTYWTSGRSRASASFRAAAGTRHGPLRRVSFDALILSALRNQAAAAHVDWSVVLEADAADRGSRNWINLQRLVQRTLPTLRSTLLQGKDPILLVSAGLLARYDLMMLITEIEASAGRAGHTPSVWILLPTANQGLPVIDGVAVPIVNDMHNTRGLTLPQAWVENRHRAGSAA